MTLTNKNNSGFGFVGLFVLLAVICVVGVIGAVVLNHESNKAMQSSAKKTVASTALPVSKPTTTTAPKATPVASPPAAAPLGPNVVKIPELGIEIGVPDSLKDLTYATGTVEAFDMTSGTSAYLSTKSLGAADSNCALDASGAAAGSIRGPLGVIGRIDGTYPANPPSTLGTLVLQASGFYIVYKNQNYQCSSIPDVQAQVQSDLKALVLNKTTVQTF